MAVRTWIGFWLACCVAGCAHGTVAEHSWRVLETEHLRLRTDMRPSTARRMAERLEARLQLIASNSFPCAQGLMRERIEITVFAHERDFRLFVPKPTVGRYVARDPGITLAQPQVVMWSSAGEEAVRIFQHEFTHHLVQLCHAAAPPWLHEGLAQYMETATLSGGKFIVGRPAVVAWAGREVGFTSRGGRSVELVPRTWVPEATALVEMDHQTFYADGGSDERARRIRAGNYAAAAILVHYFENSDGPLQQRYQRYLADLAAGRSHRVAFAQAFRGLDLDDAFQRAVEATSYLTVRVEAAAPATEVERISDLSIADVHAHLGTLRGWESAGAQRQTRQHVTLGLATDPRHTDLRLLQVQLMLAEGGVDRAMRTLRTWLAEQPADPQVLRATLDLHTLYPAEDKDATDLRELAARLPRPRTAGDLELVARCALVDDDLTEAHRLLSQALAQDPLCAPCYLTMASLRLLQNKPREADAAATRAAQLSGEHATWVWVRAAHLRALAADLLDGRGAASHALVQ